jgi:hypothetical protein
MKKKMRRKLTLSRETLRSLDLGRVVGAATLAAGCATLAYRCTNGCDTTDPVYTANTCTVCSAQCETGGACTVTCTLNGTSCC